GRQEATGLVDGFIFHRVALERNGAYASPVGRQLCLSHSHKGVLQFVASSKEGILEYPAVLGRRAGLPGMAIYRFGVYLERATCMASFTVRVSPECSQPYRKVLVEVALA